MDCGTYDALRRADTAMARGDYVNAVRYALTASAAPKGEEGVRCDAFLMLAEATLALNRPEAALEFALGAQLSACCARDPGRESRAAEILSLILVRHPYLGRDRIECVSH